MDFKSRDIRYALVVVFLISILCGCATIQPLGTPSGKPEVTISSAKKKKVVDAITNRMLNWGYNIRSVNDYNVVYGKKSDSVMAAALLGSKYDSTPEVRISYAVVDVGPDIRVIATLEMVTNPGSAFERVTDFSRGKDAQNVQNMLMHVQHNLELSGNLSKKGTVGIEIDGTGTILRVVDGRPASIAGLKAGDRIVKINGIPVPTGDTRVIALKIVGEPDTMVELGVIRDGNELTFQVKRQIHKE